MRLPRKAFLLTVLLLGCSGEEIQEKKDVDEELNEINLSASDNSKDDSFKSSSIDNEEIAPHPEIQFLREATYGSTDDVIVGMIGSFTVDKQGQVFITDRNQTIVHVFQSDGKFLTSLGRQGRGPGEFMAMSPYTMMAIHSNRLYITDYTDLQSQFPYRMHEFLQDDLSFSRTIKLLAENRADFEELTGHYPNKFYPLNDNRFIVSYHQSGADYLEGQSFIYYTLQDSSGNIISGPVLKQKDRTNLTTIVDTDYGIPYQAISTFPFFGKSLLTASGDNELYAVNHSEEFKIDIYTPQGEHLRTIEHPFDNVPFNEKEVLDLYDRVNFKSELGDGVALRMIREADNLPESWPAIKDLIIDDENRLWVSTIVDDFDIYEWWILNKSGDVITKFEWPRDYPIEVVRNGYIFTRETEEETGLEKVVRHRIEFK